MTVGVSVSYWLSTRVLATHKRIMWGWNVMRIESEWRTTTNKNLNGSLTYFFYKYIGIYKFGVLKDKTVIGDMCPGLPGVPNLQGRSRPWHPRGTHPEGSRLWTSGSRPYLTWGVGPEPSGWSPHGHHAKTIRGRPLHAHLIAFSAGEAGRTSVPRHIKCGLPLAWPNLDWRTGRWQSHVRSARVLGGVQ